MLTPLASGFGYSAAGSVIGKVGTFATTILLARVLGPTAFGAFALVRATVTMFASFSNLGLHGTAGRYLPRSENSVQRGGQLLGFVLVVGAASLGAAALLLVVLAPSLAEQLYNEPLLVPLLVMGAVWLFGAAGTDLLHAVLAGLREFRTMAALAAASGIALLPLVLALVWFFGGTAATAVAGYAAASLLTLCLGGAMLRLRARERGLRPSWQWDSDVLRGPVLRFAVPAYLFVLLQAPVSWFVITLLALVPGGFALVGIVRAVDSLRGALLFFPGVLYQVLLPVLSSAFKEGDATSFSQGVVATNRLLWFFTTPAVMLVGGGLPAVLWLFFGPEYAAFAAPAAVLLTIVLWSVPTQAHERVLAAMGRMWTSLGLLAGMALLLITLAVWLVPRLGLWGFVVAEGISYIMYGLALHGYVGRVLKVRNRAWEAVLVFGIVTSAATIALAHLSPAIETVVLSALGAAAFASSQWFLLLEASDRMAVRLLVTAVRRRLDGSTS